ncbi:MAG TPA: squalene synthase HpnC, partial [Bacteroidetes bacterium]|nr:squalene synthase HpnC [Bacteroidota bacterium]
WQDHLDVIYQGGECRHPAFIALAPVIREHGIERGLFEKMLEAFRRDQTVRRYLTWEELRGYTAGSADPVGRWVLRLYGYRDPELDRLSDEICTGLQLVNFLQDVREDYLLRDRIYLPEESRDRFGVSEEMFGRSPTPAPLRELLRDMAGRAERLLAAGRPLIRRVRPELARQLVLFHGGGRLALRALRCSGYNPASRPVRVSRVEKAALLLRALRGVPL